MMLDERKFDELMLFLAELSDGDPQYGRVKLAKQMFFCDFMFYARFRRPITGATYRKEKNGPLPVHAFHPALERLVQTGRAAEKRTRLAGYDHERKALVALEPADLAVFSQEEQELAHMVVKRLWHLNGIGASDLSHEFIGWKLARPGEDIPYDTAFLDEVAAPLTPADIERAKRFASA